jgi:hypothetical protein
MHDRFPIYWTIVPGAMLNPWEEEIVNSAVDYYNTLASLVGVPALFLRDPLAPILEITRNPYPANPKKWGSARCPEPAHWPIKRVHSCTIELHPRWFECGWAGRKENLVRHELGHVLGFSHATSIFSLMHPDYCTAWWRPWRIDFAEDERSALARYWNPSAR